jgi:hypothetical protein
MAQGRASARLAAATAIMLASASLGLMAAPAQAVTSTERADTLAQARDDTAIKAGQVVTERLHSANDKDWFRYVVAERTRAVITLGALPANYSLALYRADGTRVTLSDHSGKGFERIFFTAAPGTYFVRVASTKGAGTAKYRLRLRALSAPLALMSYTVPKINSGYPWVVAEFVNTTGDWLRVNFVSVNSIAADGRTLHRDGTNLTQGRVAPYGLLHVASSTLFPLPAGHDHFQVSATGSPIEPVSLSALKRRSGPTVTRDGYRVHTGTVTNTDSIVRGGEGERHGPSVNVTYYNANGTIIGTQLTNLPTMAPGQTVKYELIARHSYYWNSPFPKPNRYETRLVAAW